MANAQAAATTNGVADPRLILSEEGLDRALETFLLAEAAFWTTVDRAMDAAPGDVRLGRGHFRAAFLLKRRPGLGVQELTRLTGLSKQGASKVLRDLAECGYAEAEKGGLDARRRPTRLTPAGAAFEARTAAALRAQLAAAYREGGLDAAPGALRVLAAIAGPKTLNRQRDEP